MGRRPFLPSGVVLSDGTARHPFIKVKANEKQEKNLFLLLFSPSFFLLKDKHKNTRMRWYWGLCLPPTQETRSTWDSSLFRQQWLQMLISDGEVGSLQISDSSSSCCFLLHLDVMWQKHHTVTANSCQLESCTATQRKLANTDKERQTDSSNRFNRRGNSLFYFSEWSGRGGSHSTRVFFLWFLFLVLLFIF